MNEKTAARRPYIRSMQCWWRRDTFFMVYMARELTAFAVLGYALVLMVGVLRLSQGEIAFNGWLAALRSPWSLLLHFVFLLSMVIHAKSWFEIMPKTMPMMFIGDRRVSATLITRAGWAATVLATLAVLALACWGQS